MQFILLHPLGKEAPVPPLPGPFWVTGFDGGRTGWVVGGVKSSTKWLISSVLSSVIQNKNLQLELDGTQDFRLGMRSPER